MKIRLTKAGPEKFYANPTEFLGGAFHDYVTACKAVGVRFNPDRRCNEGTNEQLARLIIQLSTAGFLVSIEPALEAELERQHRQHVWSLDHVEDHMDRADRLMAQAGAEFYPYQRQGVKALRANAAKYLLGDDMGLGKTLQALMSVPIVSCHEQNEAW